MVSVKNVIVKPVSGKQSQLCRLCDYIINMGLLVACREQIEAISHCKIIVYMYIITWGDIAYRFTV